MRRWALTALLVVLLALSGLAPHAWALSLSSGPGSLPTVSCPDTGGNHLNFSGGAWTCGISTPGGGVPGNAFADGVTKGLATFSPAHFLDDGSGLITLATTQGGLTLSNTNTYLTRADRWTLQDATDATRQARFQLTAITPGTTRILTVPDYDATVATLAGPETLTAKTLSGLSNTFSNVPETALTFTDVLSGNASTLSHGFVPKLPGNTTQFLRADGTFVEPVAGIPVGPIGTLQAAGSAGQLAGFSGSNCTVPGTFAVGQTSNGTLLCSTPSTTGTLSSARAVLVQPSPDMPNGINLGALPAGLLTSSVSSGVATLNSRAAPTGAILGTDDVQEVDNKRINQRVASLSGTSPVTVDLSTMDVVYISALAGATLFNAPTGVAKPGQWLRLQVHSAVSQPVTWDPTWDTGAGFPLPTATSGGGLYDTYLFQYNSGTGKLDMIYNSQLSRLALPTGVTPGVYACPRDLEVNEQGKIVTVVDGDCTGGGGGGTASAAGRNGDVQFRLAGNLAADSGILWHDWAGHRLQVPNLRTSLGPSRVEFVDGRAHTLSLVTPPLSSNQLVSWPDRSGKICVQGDPACGGAGGSPLTIQELDGTPTGTPSVLKVSNGALTDNGDGSFTLVTGAGGGDFSSNTTTSVDGEVMLFSGTGGKTGKRATGTGLAKLTAGVQSTVTAPTGAVVGDTDAQTLTNKRMPPRVTTLTSAATNPSFQCDFAAGEQCEVVATGGTGTLTVQAPTGSLSNGELRMLLFLCSATQTFAWDAVFVASPNVPLPTSCPSGTSAYFSVGVRWSTVLTKFQALASN